MLEKKYEYVMGQKACSLCRIGYYALRRLRMFLVGQEDKSKAGANWCCSDGIIYLL